MHSKKLSLILFVVVLGIAIVGVANATIINNAQSDQPAQMPQGQSNQPVNTSDAVTPEQVKQMIQTCWQMDQTVVDQWIKATGMSQADLLKMEQNWMQNVMQQNPNLSVQDAYNMQQNWMQNIMAKYQHPVQTKQVNQSQQPSLKYQNPSASSQRQVYPQNNYCQGPRYGSNCYRNNGYCW